METPPLTDRSIWLNAQDSLLPSLHPYLAKTPKSGVISCSRFTPKPYFFRSGAPPAHGPVDLAECPGFALAVAPPVSRKDAEIRRDLLLQVHAEAVFLRTRPAGRRQIGEAVHEGRIPKRAGALTIQVSQKTQGARAPLRAVALLPLGHLATILRDPGIESRAVRLRRLHDACHPQGPGAHGQFLHRPDGIAPYVGRIVPRAVVHQRPVHELTARIVAVPVVVKIVRQGELTRDQSEPADRLRSGYLTEAGVSAMPATLAENLTRVVTPTLERHKKGGAVAEKFEAAYRSE